MTDRDTREEIAQIVKACCGCGLDIACSVHDPLVERIADRLLAAGLVVPSGLDSLWLTDPARFAPMGDNHHNAVACPYCSANLPKPVPSGLTAEKLRAIADGLEDELQHVHPEAHRELREWADAMKKEGGDP